MGRGMILCIPRMPLCGGFKIGVANREPYTPPFVIVNGKSQYSINDPLLLLIHALAILTTGVLAALAAFLMLVGRERRGLRLGTLALVLSLTIVDLLTFYFSQLYAVGDALAQLVLLLGLVIYRWRFYLHDESQTNIPATISPEPT